MSNNNSNNISANTRKRATSHTSTEYTTNSETSSDIDDTESIGSQTQSQLNSLEGINTIDSNLDEQQSTPSITLLPRSTNSVNMENANNLTHIEPTRVNSSSPNARSTNNNSISGLGSYAIVDNDLADIEHSASILRNLHKKLEKTKNEFEITELLRELSHEFLIVTSDSLEKVRFVNLVNLLVNLFEGNLDVTGLPTINNEIMLLSCRCLINLMNTTSGAIGRLLIKEGILHIVKEKLQNMEYMDTAEECIELMEKITKSPIATITNTKEIINNLLEYFDFYSGFTQLSAISIIKNVCHNISYSSGIVSGLPNSYSVFSREEDEDEMCADSGGQPSEIEDFIKRIATRCEMLLSNEDFRVVIQSLWTIVYITDGYKNDPEFLSNHLFSSTLVANLILVINTKYRDLNDRKYSKYSNKLMSIFLNTLSNIFSSLELCILFSRNGFIEMLAVLLERTQAAKSDSNNSTGSYDAQLTSILSVLYGIMPFLPKARVFDLKPNKDYTTKISISKKQKLLTASYNEEKIFEKIYQYIIPLLIKLYTSTPCVNIRTLVLCNLIKILYYTEIDVINTIQIHTKIEDFVMYSLTDWSSYQIAIKCIVFIEVVTYKFPELFVKKLTRCGVFSILENEKKLTELQEESFGNNNQEESSSITQAISRGFMRTYESESRAPSYLINAIERLIDSRLNKNVNFKNKELRTEFDKLSRLSPDDIKQALNLKLNLLKEYVQDYTKNTINIEEFSIFLNEMDNINTDQFGLYTRFFDILGGLLKCNNTESGLTAHELVKHGIIDKLTYWLSSNNKEVDAYFKMKFVEDEELGFVLINKIHKLISIKESFIIERASMNNNFLPRVYDSSLNSNNQTVRLSLEPLTSSKDSSSEAFLANMCCVSNFEFIVEYLHTNQQNNLRINSNETYLECMIPSLDINKIELHDDHNGMYKSSNNVSYSKAACKDKDEHTYEFYIAGKLVKSNKTTIYKALHEHSKESKTSGFWYSLHQIQFKKIKKSQKASITCENSDWSNPEIKKPLDLMSILHKKFTTNRGCFINDGLNNKIAQQFSETVITLSDMIPSWVEGLIKEYPFLINHKNKDDYLCITRFGFIRNILRSKAYDHNELYSLLYHRLNYKTKALINRGKLFENGIKIMKKYANSKSILEIEFVDEIGTGLGPSLEFYSNYMKEFKNRKWKMWRNQVIDDYCDDTFGLFPAVNSEGDNKVDEMFKLFGISIAKAIVDSRPIEVFINPLFIRQAIEFNPHGTIEMLQSVDPQLASAIVKISSQIQSLQKIDREGQVPLLIDGTLIEDLCLTFTIPGLQTELIENGSEKIVNTQNASEYVELLLEKVVGRGIRSSVESFKQGFDSVLDIKSFNIYNEKELVQIFGGNMNIDEHWTSESLRTSIKTEHGYTSDSKTVENFIDILTKFNASERRMFVKFISGRTILPEKGFGGLKPNLTIVRKECESRDDDYLPSVMTCAHYLKMPNYTSKKTMSLKLKIAIAEGCESFHLS